MDTEHQKTDGATGICNTLSSQIDPELLAQEDQVQICTTESMVFLAHAL